MYRLGTRDLAYWFLKNKRLRLLCIVLPLGFSCGLETQAQEMRYEYAMGGKAVSKEAYDAFEKGRQLLRVNNNADAAAMLKWASELMPDNADVRHTYALALAKTGQPAAAIQELQIAITLNPMLAPSWLTLGGLYQSTGQLDKAIESYKVFLQRFPTDRDAKKIAGLVTGLEGELVRQQALHGQTGQQPRPTDNDYFVEVTREGLIRWNQESMPLRVFITSGDGIFGYKPQFAELMKQSFLSWSEASAGLVSFAFVDNPEQAHIVCLWSSDPVKFKNIAESGHAVLDSSTKRGLVKGTITILTVPLVEQVPVTDNRMRRTCLHEIGHVLGLAGHTSNPADAMFHTIGVEDTWKDLSARDANTIQRLYSRSLSATGTQ